MLIIIWVSVLMIIDGKIVLKDWKYRVPHTQHTTTYYHTFLYANIIFKRVSCLAVL
jgi:hypothetical protein